MGWFKRLTGIDSGINLGKGTKRAFGGVGKALKGEKDKLNWIPPEKLIAKPTEQETALLGGLFPYAQSSIGRARNVGNIAWNSGLLGQALNNHRWLFGQTINELQDIASGNLPDPYKRAVNTVFKNQLGDILNQTAKRGIVNSSITQRAINDALTKAMDMQVNYLPVAAKMTTLPYTFGTTKPLGLFGSLRDIEKDYASMPANMWNSLMSARYRVTAMPVVKKGKPGLLGGLGMLGGAAIGAYFGGPAGALVGSQIGGYLGNTGSYYL